MKKVVNSLFVAAAAFIMSCAGSQSASETVSEGSASKFDSLSYALGANVGFSVVSQMGDVPFDFDAIADGLKAGAFESGDVTPEDALETLRDYFMNTRSERAEIVAEKRAEADSVAIANGASQEDVIKARAA